MGSNPTTKCPVRVSNPGLLLPESDAVPTELPGALVFLEGTKEEDGSFTSKLGDLLEGDNSGEAGVGLYADLPGTSLRTCKGIKN